MRGQHPSPEVTSVPGGPCLLLEPEEGTRDWKGLRALTSGERLTSAIELMMSLTVSY